MGTIFRRSVITPVMLAGLFASTTVFGATIELASVVANPSFELGNQASGCPTGWVCTGSPAPGFTSYVVTPAQYTAGSDGLSGGRIVPFGIAAATSPTNVEGSGDLVQTGLGTYVAGNTYTISGYIGTPKTLPIDNTTPTGQIGTFRVYFTGTGGAQLFAMDLTIPAVGQWSPFQVSFTPTGAQLGQSIGLDFHVDSTPVGGGSGNNRIINLDLGGSAVPEPASLLLGGLGIVGLGLLGRRKRAA